MARRISVLDLSNELLKDILDHIDSNPERFLSIDRRAYLSVESFRPPSPPPPSRVQDVGNFRLICRRFSEIAIPHQFTRVATRFSVRGFERLERIASRPHLAKHTRKFSYLVPFFYIPGADQAQDVLRNTSDPLSSVHAHNLEEKARSQTKLRHSGEDLRVLKRAMAAFTSLQHVQILRLQDESDRRIVELMRGQNIDRSNVVDMKWTPACIHASKTVAQALLHAHSPFNRFSGPMMNAPSILELGKRLPGPVSELGAQLTCLELHFDGGPELNEQMMRTSGMFRSIFLEARNLQALHMGFPSRLPLNMKLDDIFHGIKWDRLRAFGIQAWRLEASEIIELARRHSRTLRGLRLRDVILREGSLWKDILSMLRAEMHQLAWVSLRRIDYESHFDDVWANSMEVAELSLGDTSGSDDEDDRSYQNGIHGSDLDDIEEEDEGYSDDDTDNNDSEVESEANTDNGPEANDLAIPPDTPVSLPFCTCSRSSYPASADDLGDNGKLVTYQQRKLWEKWVIGQCPEHDRGSA